MHIIKRSGVLTAKFEKKNNKNHGFRFHLTTSVCFQSLSTIKT